MTASSRTEPFMVEAWDRAVRSAGFDPARVHLLPIPGAAVGGYNQAANYPPGRTLVDDADDLIRGRALIEANRPEHINKHRVAIYEDVESDDPVAVAIMAGKLRHELRHAEQRDACGDELQALDDLAQQLVSWKVGGLDGGATLYHLKPTEMDADAASAMFLRLHYPDEVAGVLASEDASLARSNTPAGDLLDLPAKTVAFMFELREVAEDPGRSNDLTFAERLGLIRPRWAELWEHISASRS